MLIHQRSFHPEGLTSHMASPQPHTPVFYILATIAATVAILPYVCTHFFGYAVISVTINLACAVRWFACFAFALWTQHWHWWRRMVTTLSPRALGAPRSLHLISLALGL